MFRWILFLTAMAFSLSPWLNPGMALILGFVLSLWLGHPFKAQNKNLLNWLLKSAVVALGFGIEAEQALAVSKDGFLLTLGTIISVLILAFLLGKWLKLPPKSAYLLGSGTAICGGSAIAAVAPVIDANERDISMAMGTVFLLNSLALLLFPLVGTWLELSQYQFGLWSAIAIHDTSSVVGAATQYGTEALKVATTVKLARALWIIPLALFSALIFKGKGRLKWPWFIFLFLLVVILGIWTPYPAWMAEDLPALARRLFSLVLFLVGAGISLEQIKRSGWPAIILGLLLWVFVSVTSLAFIHWL